MYDPFSDNLKSVLIHCLQSASGHLQWCGLRIMMKQAVLGKCRVCAAPADSASRVLYSPGEPLESGPEQRHIIQTWKYLPSSERSRSLGKREGWRLHFVTSAVAL